MNEVPAVEFRAVTKRFGPVLANNAINLTIQPGSIHGIIGENGAGKSTAMNLLYGLYRPNAGQILVQGKPSHWQSPADAIAGGVGMVHQHFMLAGPHTALENILLGAEPLRWGRIDRRSARAELQRLAVQYGLALDLDRPVESLPVGVQQRVELLKLLYRRARILILDEPTAVLNPLEVRNLFDNLQRLRNEGKTILFVSHKLNEVTACTDRVTVMRAGQVVADLETRRTTAQELANLMVGRKVVLARSVAPGRPAPDNAIDIHALSFASAESRRSLSSISFQVKRGEIVGIAGVEGNGQTELVQALLHGSEPGHHTTGRVSILGHDVRGWRAARIRALGVALIPEDRLRDGLLPDRPLTENFLLGLQHSPAFASSGWLRLRHVRSVTARALDTYDVRPRDPGAAAGTLSGGNQQKLIVAREFERQPQLLLAAQPTRGVDVGAIEFIHQQMVQARDRGAGVLLISSELDEILALSDRILVMYEGRIVAEFARGNATEQDLGLKMGGG